MEILKKINYQLLGVQSTSSCPVVFLHGLMGYLLNWRKIAQTLQDDRQVLIFDQRGHGKSFKPDTGYRPEDYANDLNEILLELGWHKIDLVGHSMGGRNALNFASRFPQKVNRLVIVDIGPEVAPGSLERIHSLVKLVPVPFSSKMEAKEFFMNTYPQLIQQASQPKTLAQYFYSNMEEKPDGTVSWRFQLEGILTSLIEGRAINSWQEWDNLKMPILVIKGEKSEDLTTNIFLKMMERNPHSKGIEIKGAGHWVHFDKPDYFSKVLRIFLESTQEEILRQNFDFPESSS